MAKNFMEHLTSDYQLRKYKLSRPNPTPFHRPEGTDIASQTGAGMEIHTYPTAAFPRHKDWGLPPPPDCFLRLAKKRPIAQEESVDRPTKRSRPSDPEETDCQSNSNQSEAATTQCTSQPPEPSQTLRPQTSSSLSPPPQRIQSLAQKRSNPDHETSDRPKKRSKGSKPLEEKWIGPPVLTNDALLSKPASKQQEISATGLAAPPSNELPRKHRSKRHQKERVEPPVLPNDDLSSAPASKPQETSSSSLATDPAAQPNDEARRKRRSKRHRKEFVEPPVLTNDELSLKLIPAQVKRMTAKVGYPGRNDEWGKPSRVLAAIAAASGSPPAPKPAAKPKKKAKATGKRKGARKAAAPKPAAGMDNAAKDETNAADENAVIVVQDDNNTTSTDASTASNTQIDLTTEPSSEQAIPDDADAPTEPATVPEAPATILDTASQLPSAALAAPPAIERASPVPPPFISVHNQPQRVSHVRWSSFEGRIHATNPSLLRAGSPGLVAGVRKRSAEFLALVGEEEEQQRGKRVCRSLGSGGRGGAGESEEEETGQAPDEDRSEGKDDGYNYPDDDDGAAAFDAGTEQKMAALVREAEVKRRLTGALEAWREEQARIEEREKAEKKARAEALAADKKQRAQELEADVREELEELLPGFGLEGQAKTKAMEEFDAWFAGLSADAQVVAMEIVMEGGDWANGR